MLGAFSGWVAITLLEQVRKRVGVRRDYESLYALGVAFTAYAAAEAVGGSGFLAAFAAGLVIAALDVELCDCFLDYGEASAEMFLLFTFVAFGAGLIWTGFPLAGDWHILAFAAVALLARTLVLLPVLARSGVDDRNRRVIACRPREAELAPLGPAAGVCRGAGVGPALRHHLPRGPPVGRDPRGLDRAVPPAVRGNSGAGFGPGPRAARIGGGGSGGGAP